MTRVDQVLGLLSDEWKNAADLARELGAVNPCVVHDALRSEEGRIQHRKVLVGGAWQRQYRKSRVAEMLRSWK